MKRGHEADETAILDAVASWGRPLLKRMRASPAWPDARLAAFAAVVGQKGTSAVEEEIGAAISSWAGPARLGSVLEALGHLHSSEVFKALLASAQEKASRLEQAAACARRAAASCSRTRRRETLRILDLKNVRSGLM